MDSVKVLSSNLNAVSSRRRFVKQPSFGLNATEAAKTALSHIDDLLDYKDSTYGIRKDAKEYIEKNFLIGAQKFFNGLGKSMGEIQNTLINAADTALVAPIFIAYNPIAKEDKETRVYSAWRQPVSAVLTIAAQVGLNLPFEKYLNRLADEGKLGENYDMRIKPSGSYLLAQAKDKGEKIAEDMAEKYVEDKHADLFNNRIRENLEKLLEGPKEGYEKIWEKAEEVIKAEKIEKLGKYVAEEVTDAERMKKFGTLVAKETKEKLINQIKQTEYNVKGYKQQLMLVLALITMPPTCSLLNWAYPRFMEMMFPEKYKVQKTKGGK